MARGKTDFNHSVDSCEASFESRRHEVGQVSAIQDFFLLERGKTCISLNRVGSNLDERLSACLMSEGNPNALINELDQRVFIRRVKPSVQIDENSLNILLFQYNTLDYLIHKSFVMATGVSRVAIICAHL